MFCDSSTLSSRRTSWGITFKEIKWLSWRAARSHFVAGQADLMAFQQLISDFSLSLFLSWWVKISIHDPSCHSNSLFGRMFYPKTRQTIRTVRTSGCHQPLVLNSNLLHQRLVSASIVPSMCVFGDCHMTRIENSSPFSEAKSTRSRKRINWLALKRTQWIWPPTNRTNFHSIRSESNRRNLETLFAITPEKKTQRDE